MKTISHIIVTVCLSAFTFLANANNRPVNVKSESDQIKSYLGKLEFKSLVQNTSEVKISFFINDKNEIIITSTNNTKLDAIIKSGLNHKKIDVSLLERNKAYIIPVHVTLRN